MIPFVGLTGGIASGKSTASAQFASHGVPVVDADDVGHMLYEAGGKAVKFVKREFGPDFIDSDGSVARDMLREEVFKDQRVRKRLEAITHPLIRKECLTQMNRATGIYGILVAPLMFESEFITESLERVLVIDCDEKVQLAHGLSRGRFTEEQLRRAMKAQMGREGRLKRADDVIVNDGDYAQLAAAVDRMHEGYLERFNKA